MTAPGDEPMTGTRRSVQRTRARARFATRLWLLPALILVVATAVIPVVVLARATVTTSSIGTTLARPSVLDAIRFSAWQAMWSTALTMAIGSVLAWIIAQYEFRGRRFLRSLLTVPFVLPTVVVGSAFLALLPASIERSLGSILLAHVFFNVSVVIRLVSPQWSMLDARLLEAARSLGASAGRVVTRVVLSSAGSALRSAAALVFLMSFTSYGVVRILGGAGLNTVEVEIYRRAVLIGDVSGATVLAVIQTVAIVAVFAIATRRPSVASRRIDIVRRRAPRWSVVTSVLAGILVLVPLVAMIVRSVNAGGRWTLAGWRNVIAPSGTLLLTTDLPAVVTRSLGFAVVAACIAVPVGIAAAVGLARQPNIAARTALVAPMATSAVVIGFGILVTYDSPPFDFRSAWWLIPCVHAVIAVPFVARSSLAVLESIPPGLRDAASVLGASPARRWWAIDARLMAPALASGLGLSTALSLGEFGATSFLTRRGTQTLPIVIDQLLGRAGDTAFTTAMAAATILLLLTVGAVTGFDAAARTKGSTWV